MVMGLTAVVTVTGLSHLTLDFFLEAKGGERRGEERREGRRKEKTETEKRRMQKKNEDGENREVRREKRGVRWREERREGLVFFFIKRNLNGINKNRKEFLSKIFWKEK